MQLLAGAQDAAYSPDGTLIAFVRSGDLWLANAGGSGQRMLAATPGVDESGPVWTANGSALIYAASVGGARQIRIFALPSGPSRRIAASDTEEWSPALSRSGRLAFVSSRNGATEVFVAEAGGTDSARFDAAAPATPPADIRGLVWSPDGTRLAYTVVADDGSSALTVDDGVTQTVLSVAPAHDEHPVWSPTGTRLAFGDGAGNLVSVAADGSDRRALGAGTPLDWRTVPVDLPRFPNLVQRPPSGLEIVRSARGRWLLGFTSMVDNRGPGILWIRGSRPAGSRLMQVRQLVQLAGGGVRVVSTAGVLRYTVAAPHYHWHYLGFDRYELRRTGDLALLVRDRKSGFCLADHYEIAVGVAHRPPRFLGSCAQFHPEASEVEEGSSVGYTDRYPAYFHGQALDVTTVPAGSYWLVHQANSDFELRESSYADETASLLIRISWPAGRRAAPRIVRLRACSRDHC
jgi:lysyl oxidase/WD40 repeat protein